MCMPGAPAQGQGLVKGLIIELTERNLTRVDTEDSVLTGRHQDDIKRAVSVSGCAEKLL